MPQLLALKPETIFHLIGLAITNSMIASAIVFSSNSLRRSLFQKSINSKKGKVILLFNKVFCQKHL